MARKLRVEYAGAIYHVMNRGDRREPIFKDGKDRERFLVTLGEARAKTGSERVTLNVPSLEGLNFLSNTPLP
jgi:hypothetical protein